MLTRGAALIAVFFVKPTFGMSQLVNVKFLCSDSKAQLNSETIGIRRNSEKLRMKPTVKEIPLVTFARIEDHKAAISEYLDKQFGRWR